MPFIEPDPFSELVTLASGAARCDCVTKSTFLSVDVPRDDHHDDGAEDMLDAPAPHAHPLRCPRCSSMGKQFSHRLSDPSDRVLGSW